jgi:transposase-like protein
VAAELGVHPESLGGWIRQAEADAGERDDLLTTEEKEGLAQLRREVRELRRANGVPRTASAFSPHSCAPRGAILIARATERPKTPVGDTDGCFRGLRLGVRSGGMP